MSLAVVKILLVITGIGMPIMVIVPKSPTIRYAFAAAIPLILFTLYQLIKCAAENQAYTNAANKLHAVKHWRSQKRGSFASDD